MIACSTWASRSATDPYTGKYTVTCEYWMRSSEKFAAVGGVLGTISTDPDAPVSVTKPNASLTAPESGGMYLTDRATTGTLRAMDEPFSHEIDPATGIDVKLTDEHVRQRVRLVATEPTMVTCRETDTDRQLATDEMVMG